MIQKPLAIYCRKALILQVSGSVKMEIQKQMFLPVEHVPLRTVISQEERPLSMLTFANIINVRL